jgi:MoxR-like ATPase
MIDMTKNGTRIAFKKEIDKLYGDGTFTTRQAYNAIASSGLGESTWSGMYALLRKHCLVERGVLTFKDRCGVDESKPSKEAVKKEVKKTIKKDWDIISEKEVLVNEFDNSPTPEASQPDVLSMAKLKPTVINLVPKKDPQYVAWGHFKDIKSILESKVFYPMFVTGLSGNGKTSMIREVCAKLKRDMVRVNITVETDEDDLLGGFRLVNGETVWQDGPLVVAMKTGAIALIDEVDLASHKIMCLQPIMEGQPIYLKKINEVVYPAAGFNIVATANTKGKGSSDGRFMGTNILNEAFLDRFSATFYQEYPSTSFEEKILKKQFAKYEINEDDFVSKLVKWADVIRRSFKEGAVDDIITTRRLIDITKTFSIFGNKMKSITLCLERFDDETRDSFADLYTKVDAGASFEDISNEAEIEVEEEITDEDGTF